MAERRFQLVEPRALWELGLPLLAVWIVLLVQLLVVVRADGVRPFVLHWRDLHFNFLTHLAVVAAGTALLWAWVLWRSNSYLVVGPEGLALYFGRRRRWFIPWEQFLTWEWERDWLGHPVAIIVRCTELEQRRLQLGLGHAGWRVGPQVRPNLQYTALLEALAQYVPHKGKGWAETQMAEG